MNALFNRLAKTTYPEWGNKKWFPHNERDYTESTFPELRGCNTHCGTQELAGLHGAKGTARKIVQLCCYAACRQDEGFILYYAPHSPEYDQAIATISQLGFKKLYEATHLGYLTRAPDKGRFSLYCLEITPKERKKLIEKCKPSKESARNARRQTRSARSRGARSIASPVDIIQGA